MNTMTIAIDGPAAAGKSTVAKKVAEELSFIYVDTGAMYRALTWKALKHKVSLEDEEALTALLKETELNLIQSPDGQRVILDGKDVSDDIRTDEVTNQVSIAAKHRLVREEMVRRQQELVKDRGVVMDGRDIGTHVLPQAEVKVFMIASVEERAERRHKENLKKGFQSDLQQLKEDIRKRDEIDSNREIAPLVKAADAVEVDTTSMDIEEVVSRILDIVKEKAAKGE
ncbi:(d)CMP kinase [Halobacillus sp. ACCC02827]|uniref:(d)CMP kinase n=1 Tax=unclassified Halobacillus TaxID=2636472 RepID=UPI0002A519EC|nr:MULTISPECIES: (d)CMP kinase [unclassified Halobacillus]ELK45354.1 cytidylate kinase [Halobacillus sp. BAB-2008]WJE14110.1 (d)CMP kinase [Halobacillus sp. ACCC02827]